MRAIYFFISKLVGARRFELPTPTTPLWCATRLRYAPTEVFLASQDLKNLFKFHA